MICQSNTPSQYLELSRKQGEREEWQKVFYITGAVSLFGALVYGLFASGVEQEWAKDPWVQAFPSKSKQSLIQRLVTLGILLKKS